MKKKSIPIETLRALLICDPAQGKLFWKHRPLEYFAEVKNPGHQCAAWNTRYAGKEAFTTGSHGYRQGSIFSSLYFAHRVIWAMTTGAWPLDQIDHVNGVKDDNRIENLRAVTCTENMRNAAMPRNNTTGVMGVVWNKRDKKWQAQIMVGGKQIYLGLFDDLEEAAAARAAAEIEFGYHENHGRAIATAPNDSEEDEDYV